MTPARARKLLLGCSFAFFFLLTIGLVFANFRPLVFFRPLYLRVMIAYFIVFLGSGYFLKWIFFRKTDFDLFEGAAASFALNLPVLGLIAVSIFESEGTVHSAVHLLTAIQLILLVFAAARLKVALKKSRKKNQPDDGPSPAFPLMILAACALCLISFAYFHLGGLTGGETPANQDALVISGVRKLSSFIPLHFDAVSYRPNTLLPTLYAPFQFALALTAHLSGLDPLSVYAHYRAFSVVITLCVYYAILKALIRNRAGHWISFTTLIFLLWAQLPGDMPAHLWGGLAPYAHPRDIAGGILMPLVLWLAARSLKAGREKTDRFESLIPFVVLITAAVHPQIVFPEMAFLILVFCIIFTRSTRSQRRCVLKKGLLAIGGSALGLILYVLRIRAAGGNLDAFTGDYFISSAQMISVALFILFGASVWVGTLLSEKNIFYFIGAVLVFFFSPALLALARAEINRTPSALYFAAAAAFIGLLVLYGQSEGRLKNLFSIHDEIVPRRILITGLFFTALVLGCRENFLNEKYAAARYEADVSDFESWYGLSGMRERMPIELLDLIKREVPPRSVFMSDYQDAMLVPLFTDNYALTAGFFVQEEEGFVRNYTYLKTGERAGMTSPERLRERIKRRKALVTTHRLIVEKDRPIFNTHDSAEDIRTFAQGMGIDYILVNPKFHGRLSGLLGQNPDTFHKLYDKRNFALYKVDPKPSA